VRICIKMLCWVLLVLLAASLSPFAATEGDTSSSGDNTEAIGFFFDYGLFRVPEQDNQYYLECYFGVPVNQLYFYEENGEIKAHYLLSIRLLDPDGKHSPIEDYQETYTRVDSMESAQQDKLVLDQLTIPIPARKYYLEVGVTDLSSKKLGITEVNLDATEFSRGELGTSNIQLASNIIPSTDVESPFFKNNLAVIPNPMSVFKKPLKINYYMEVYGLSTSASSQMVVRYILARPSGEIIQDVSFTNPYTSQNVILTDSVSFEKAEDGAYDFIVEIKDPVTGNTASTSKRIFMYEEQNNALLAMLTGGETLAPYTDDQALDMRERIAILANSDELARYDQLSLDLKPYFVYQFWKQRDPTPDTPENELLDAFNERYDYVMAKFTTKNKPGYLTDMGRVYLKYGPPDEISSQPMGLSSMPELENSTFQTEPTEAWEYESGGQNKKKAIFVFVDFDSDGEYSIFTSTEPGYGRLISQ
jgi:GWxTD domain-containing protein